MSALPLTLVLVAAVIHASWNLLAKRVGGDVRFVLMLQVMVAVLWAPVGLWFAWHEAPDYGSLQWGLLSASGALHMVYFSSLLRGYRLGDLSVVYPLARGTGPLLTALGANVLLGEPLGWVGGMGVVGVALGIFLIAGGPASWRRFRRGAGTPADMARLRNGVSYGLLTGVFIAAYTVVDGYAVNRAGISPVSVDYLGNVVRLPLTAAWLFFMRRGEALPLPQYWRNHYKSGLAIAALSPIAYVLVLYAARLAPLSHVAPAREVSMLCAALFGGTLLRERDAGLRLVGAASIAAGVIALASA
jgi:drug/metabolite transporter (DMT)-like permease